MWTLMNSLMYTRKLTGLCVCGGDAHIFRVIANAFDCASKLWRHNDVSCSFCFRSRATVDDCLAHPWINVSQAGYVISLCVRFDCALQYLSMCNASLLWHVSNIMYEHVFSVRHGLRLGRVLASYHVKMYMTCVYMYTCTCIHVNYIFSVRTTCCDRGGGSALMYVCVLPVSAGGCHSGSLSPLVQY